MAGRVVVDGVKGSGGFALHCRGDVRLYSGDSDCTPTAKKGRALLAILAAEQRPLIRTRIIDLLWSDRQEEQARASLRTLLADLKTQFGDRFEELLVVDRERVALGPNVRTDLADPSLSRPAGELFEGLDHIDPELDEWLRLEREKWAGGAFPIQAAAVASTRSTARQARRWALPLLLVMGAVTGFLFIRPDSNASQSEQVRHAQSLLRDGVPSEALKARAILLEVVSDEPNNVVALGALAEATMAASDHPGIGGTLPLASARREARAYSRRAIKLNPGEASGWAALGFSQFATAEAVRPLEKAVALDPNNAKYRWQLARALEYDNRYDEAYLHTRRAIELDPQGVEPMIGFIRAAAQLNRVDEMEAEVLAYGRRNPPRGDLAYVNGFLAFALSDEPKCIRYLEPLVVNGNYRPLSSLIGCLTALGEKRRAAELSSKVPSFASEILRDDVSAVERRARSMGREFWLRNFESLAAMDLLVRAGKADALIQSFDASYDSIAEFEREGGRVALEPTSILLAMQMAGRTDDARQLRDLLAKQVKGQRDGMGLDTWTLFAKAAVELADGNRDRSVSLLEQCFPDCFFGYLNMDISETAFFGRLNGHPRFDRLVKRYRSRVNARRKQAGLPALPV